MRFHVDSLFAAHFAEGHRSYLSITLLILRIQDTVSNAHEPKSDFSFWFLRAVTGFIFNCGNIVPERHANDDHRGEISTGCRVNELCFIR